MSKSRLYYTLIIATLVFAAGSQKALHAIYLRDIVSNVRSLVSQALANISNVKTFTAKLNQSANPHLLVSATYLASTTGSPSGSNLAPSPNYSTSQTTVQAYPLMAALWPSPVIEVCWENPSPQFSVQMSHVQAAIAGTWQSASRLRFTGWATCPPISPASVQVVRVEIDDSDPNNGPHTLFLGKQLAGVQHGMLLNFTFLRWGTNCQTMIDYCIKAIAVHEFGHAIALAHEQNRPDTPGECMIAPQGSNGDDTLLTPYDPFSVMNYCNKKYNNDGELSLLDKQAVAVMYGPH
jgi:hypothetical protein